MKVDVKGLVFDIKRFAIHDGPGIRTTVFLKGCPLSCLWCHNPESQDKKKEIFFMPEKCIGCGYCVQVCPKNCHTIKNNVHTYLRHECERCGKCAEQCYAHALEEVGRKMSVDEVMREVLKDRAFYTTSEGGVTISGGEPMEQFDFTKALLEDAKSNNLHTCLDTSGFAPFVHYEQLLDYVNIFLYDIKETDSDKHLKSTGVPMDLIYENIYKIDKAGAVIILQCPIIPELNERYDHFERIANLANKLSNIMAIEITPYHPLGKSKSNHLGKEYPISEAPFSEENKVKEWQRYIQERTKIVVKRR